MTVVVGLVVVVVVVVDVVEVVEVVESVVVVDSWLLVEFEASEAVVEAAELDEDEEEEDAELDEELDAALDDDWVEFDDSDVETLDTPVVEALETVELLAPLIVIATVVCWAPVAVDVTGLDVVVNVAFVTSKRILIFSFGTLFNPFFSLQLTPKTSPL